MPISDISKLRPVKLKIKRKLSGPYTRLLRRPTPEVYALGSGECSVVLRGARLLREYPLWPVNHSCYYTHTSSGWHAADFQDVEMAGAFAGNNELETRYLAIPEAFARLEKGVVIDEMAETLTPWKTMTIEKWRRHLKGPIWLTLLRIYEFEPVPVQIVKESGVQVEVRAFNAENARPVQSDKAWEKTKMRIKEIVEGRVKKSSVKYKNHGGSVYNMDVMVEETGRSRSEIGVWQRRLKRKKQIVFCGPPGTGKTYLAQRLARLVANEGGGFSELQQLHPSVAYEDFIQGIRPQNRRDQVVYEWQDGTFMRFCQRAQQHPGMPCVLVLDEINRAPLARILGELLYLLEYRNTSLVLAGSGREFIVPDNVYVIGTMNTADRSIALVDQAIIRRFSFIRLQPDSQVLATYLTKHAIDPEPLVSLVEEINRAIEHEDFKLGISFFMQDGRGLLGHLQDIWEGEVEPYIAELFYDQPDLADAFRWSGKGVEKLRQQVGKAVV